MGSHDMYSRRSPGPFPSERGPSAYGLGGPNPSGTGNSSGGYGGTNGNYGGSSGGYGGPAPSGGYG